MQHCLSKGVLATMCVALGMSNVWPRVAASQITPDASVSLCSNSYDNGLEQYHVIGSSHCSIEGGGFVNLNPFRQAYLFDATITVTLSGYKKRSHAVSITITNFTNHMEASVFTPVIVRRRFITTTTLSVHSIIQAHDLVNMVGPIYFLVAVDGDPVPTVSSFTIAS